MSAATHRVWRWQRLGAVGILALIALMPAAAGAAINVQAIADIDFGSWSASQGNVSTSSDFCVLSTRGSSGNPRDYAVTGIPWISGSFAVSGPGGASIPFTLTFTDLVTSSAEQLQPWVRTGRDKTGVANCAGVQNARLTVSFNAVDLAAAPSGSYQQRVFLRAQNNNGFGDFEDFLVRVQISDQVRISDLDPIDLGSFDGSSDLSGDDGLCVYRNSGGSAYTIQADGDGAGGAFTLTNGIATLPYLVDYDDGGGYAGLAAGVAAAMTGANSSAADCGGATNARVRVTVSAVDMSTAAPGAYSGTLTLLVAPQ